MGGGEWVNGTFAKHGTRSIVVIDGGSESAWDGKVKNLVYDTDTMAWISMTDTMAEGGGGGDASAANQVTGNASLSSIDTKVTGLASENTLLNIEGRIVISDTDDVTVTVCALPTGASTAAKQPALGTAGTASSDVITVQGIASMTALKVDGSAVTQPISNASLTTIATNTGKQPINTTGSGSGASASITGGTATTLSAPANAVGFILMALDTNTTNMRWSVGRTATAALGQQLQPGRDTGFVPVGANVSIIVESGTCGFDIQWISQS
jgi:hypothetical protein